jgi:serine/threonine protein phosphatase PrpC
MLAAHGVSHSGGRPTNEDSMLVDPAIGLFVVADGMGGHKAGEIASALAVRTIHAFVAEEGEIDTGAVAASFRLANDEILAAAEASPDYQGMGTTVVAAVTLGDRLVYGSVGDSRLYVWRGGQLTQLTQDDSWVNRVLAAAPDGAVDAVDHPLRHVLTKVVGVRGNLDPSVGDCPFDRGDTLMLCTDGLHGTVTNDAIARTIDSVASVDAIAQSLVDQALAGGATDNVTVVIVRKG